MRFSDAIAAIVTKHRWLWLSLLLLAITLCTIRIVRYQNYDSEVLNLLPSNDPAVQGLKAYQRDFSQSRELAFLLEAQSPEQLETFLPFFTNALRKQPWVVRILDGLPLETPDGLQTYPNFIAPLLLNLPEDDFQQALQLLSPAQLHKRLSQLITLSKAGSPRAEFQLRYDPTGIAALASAPLFETIALNDTFSLVSTDGQSQVISVITNQSSLDVAACKQLIETVDGFLQRVRDGFPGTPPKIYVTGRSAYVSQIASSMQRDIMLTSIVSLVIICLLFFLTYRALLPLLGITVILLFCALAALAIGTWLFYSINLIAVAFCSLLFGLGTDFGLLLFNHFKNLKKGGEKPNHRLRITLTIRSKAYSIASVTATTAFAFLALIFSKSFAFSQLGLFTSIGIILCGIAMPSFLFAFFLKDRRTKSPFTVWEKSKEKRDELYLRNFDKFFAVVTRICCPARVWTAFIAVALFGFWKLPSLGFDTTAQALEPQNAPAAVAFRKIRETFPDAFEPVIIQVSAINPAEAAVKARRLDECLEQLYIQDRIGGYSGASALILDSIRIEKNRKLLQAANLQPTIDTLSEIERSAHVQLTSTKELLRILLSKVESAGDERNTLHAGSNHPSVNSFPDLPQNSPWWFIIDRFVAPDAHSFVAFVRPITNNPLPSLEIQQAVPDARITGFSVMLDSLKPWAHSELRLFGLGVGGTILVMLALIYRNAKAWFLHVSSFFIGIGGMIATLYLAGIKINILNVLATPLILGVGVDYATHLILAALHPGATRSDISSVVKPIVLAALTTLTGFGALLLAANPALRGLGLVCSIGIGWMLLITLALVLPRLVHRTGQCNPP